MQDILSLTEAAKSLPTLDGRRQHASTVFRWCKPGIRRGAKRVTLRYVRVGRRIGIPAEALQEFFIALAEADRAMESNPSPLECAAAASPCQPATPRSRTPAQRQRDIERAERELASRGI